MQTGAEYDEKIKSYLDINFNATDIGSNYLRQC